MMSSQLSNQRNINYGLDHLSIEIQSKKNKELKSTVLEKNSNIPETNLIKKLAKFSKKDFYFRWSVLIFVCNIYNAFSAPYFLAFSSFPNQIWLIFELFAECILLSDLLGRVFLTQTMKFTSFWHLNESLNLILSLCLFFSSIPYTFITFLIQSNYRNIESAISNLCKVLRIFQIQQFIDKLELSLNFGKALKESLKIIFILLFTIHIFSCFWLFTSQFEDITGIHKWTDHFSTLRKQDFAIYIEALLWGCENLTGIVVESSFEYSDLELVVCTLIMLAGTVISGVVYSKFIDLMDAVNSPIVQTQEKLRQLQEWGGQIGLPNEILSKIKIYFNVVEQRFDYLLNYDFIPELPFALRSELNLNMFKDLIQKVKFLSLGDPSFIVAFMRYLQPRVYMKGDIIIKIGEYADEFFIVRYGTVEVLASDNLTQITLMDPGNFFGEIGVLFSKLRTVTVRAYTAVILCCIQKKHLVPVLEEFPDYLNYLKNVAEQRNACIDPDEIDVDYDLLDESISSDESDQSDELERPKIFTESEHNKKPWIMKFITVACSNAPSDYLIIDPLSYFYYLWAGILGACYTFYLIYVPFSITFEANGNTFLIFLNFFGYFVYLIDIIVSINTAIMTEYKVYYHHKDEIVRNYIVHFLYSDLISLVPIDLIFLFIPSKQYISAYLRIFRLFKYPRIKSMVKVILNEVPLIPKTLFLVFTVFFLISHYLACIYFYSAKMQDYYFDEQPLRESSSYYEYENLQSLTSKPLSDQYLSLMYWSTGIISISGYSNLFPLTNFSKCSMTLILLLSYILTLLLYAVSTKVSYMINIHYANYIKKTQILEVWMSNKRLSETEKKRVNDYYLLVWKKSSSFHTNYIIKELPTVIKKDILNYLFDCIYKSGLFPNELAPLTALVEKCRVEYYCPNGVIVNQGDLVLDVYFLIEGCVISADKEKLNENMLYKGCYFCEQFLELPRFGCSELSYTAETEVRVAALKIRDYKEVLKIFPLFKSKNDKHLYEVSDLSASSIYEIEEKNLKNKFLTSIKDTNINLSEINQTSLEMEQTSSNSRSVKVKNSISLCQKLPEKFKKITYLLVLVWNALYVPYYICMDNRLSEVGIMFEILTFLSYYSFLTSDLVCAIKQYKSGKLVLNNLPFRWYFHLISGFPVILISDFTYKSDAFLIAYCIFRLLNIYLIPKYINRLTRFYVSWYKILRLGLMLIFYFYSVHIFACLFILVGKQHPKTSWFLEIPPNTSNSKYIAALYWSSTILSHTSFGDFQLRTNTEKTFAILVFFLSWIIHGLIFGAICSLLLRFSPRLKQKIEKNSEYVINYLKKKKVFKFYKKSVENFFNHQWIVNKGIDEYKILNELNKELRVMLQISIYAKAIKKSLVLKSEIGEVNENLLRSIFNVMKIEFFSIGEFIIKIGDKSESMFFLLEGEADVLDLEGTKVLANLEAGAHFGEANIILGNDMRTASIMATQICTVGLLEKEELEIIFDAFPKFYSLLECIVEERMTRTFNSSKIGDINQHTHMILRQITHSPGMITKYEIRSEKLIAEKIASFELKHLENQWYSLYFTHFILLLYSAITLPLFIGFLFETNYIIIGLEISVIIEGIAFLWKNTNFEVFLNSENKQFGWIGLFKYNYHNHFFEDLAAISPFYLIFLTTSQDYKSILVPLSLIRLLALYRLPSITEIVEFHNRKLLQYIKPVKITMKLIFFIHSACCLWNFITVIETDSPWLSFHRLNSAIFSKKYLHSLYYSVNILASVGHNNTQPHTDTERVISILISIQAFGFFALLCGYLSSNYSKETSELKNMITKINNSLKLGSQSDIPESLKSRLKEFYTFSAYVDNRIGGIQPEKLFEHLPKKLVKSIIFKCNRYLLKKLPILALINNNELIEKLALHLEPQIFLTDDFIIYKNDIGNEMFFLHIGSVNILAQDNLKVLKTLKKGEFFGEMALVHDTKRICSVVANKPCLIYSLKKEVFLGVVKNYPEILEKIKSEGDKRKTENTLVKNKASVYYNLQYGMYASVSKSFFARQETCKIVQKLSGMKSFNAEVVSNCLDNELKSKIHTRRPQINSTFKKRFSQENLMIDHTNNFK